MNQMKFMKPFHSFILKRKRPLKCKMTKEEHSILTVFVSKRFISSYLLSNHTDVFADNKQTHCFKPFPVRTIRLAVLDLSVSYYLNPFNKRIGRYP